MAPAVVYLHIGSPKTGTTYLQDSMWANRSALAAAGILLPGHSRNVVSRRLAEVMQWKPAEGGGPPRAWLRLCDEILGWDGHSVVLSFEHLHTATAAHWGAVAASLGGVRIQVVLTVRDLARSVPAQWQSSMRQRFTWTLGEYADDVAAVPAGQQTTEGPSHHFWRRQDAPTIVRRFAGRLSPEQVRVVTVPPSGGDPDELWWRFCRACDIDPAITRPGTPRHESLGAASSELLRRLNASESIAELDLADYKLSVNHALSRQSLSSRREDERGLAIPERLRGWSETEADRIIADLTELRDLGVGVVGDLEDLRPRPSSKPYVDPDDLPQGELLEAALAGLAGMARHDVELRGRLREAKLAATAADAAAAAAASGAAAVEARLDRARAELDDLTEQLERARADAAGRVRRRRSRES